MNARAIFVALIACWGMSGSGFAQQPPGSWSHPIIPGDVVLLTVWREEDLELNQIVPQDGAILFGRLGRIDVRGMTPDSLRRHVVKEYSKYLQDAEARVQLEVHRRVRVTGAVREPGSYTLHPAMTIADAVATAGGALPDGRRDRVELRRNGEIVQVLLLTDTSPLAEAPIRSGDQLHVPERSFAARNLNVLVTAFSSLVAIGIAIATR